ncbi:SPE_1075/MLC_0560 family membrane protein [Spiroplasma endosymbiont of Stenodema calcarata]|uniref:SPE_1075/MLC_0560 family membrane protein n=1 Tax=Spiroplasma endosymbiont of Stenodema calcarata TaxID=3139328 RepID=UPI003CCAAE40
MKKLFTKIKWQWQHLWHIFLLQGFLVFIGIYLTSLGIAIYAPTSTGASQIDFTVFALLALMYGNYGNGHLHDTVLTAHYAVVLWLYYLVLILFTIIFMLITNIKAYQKTKDREIWVKFGIMIIGDLFLAWLLPLLIHFNWKYIISADAIQQWAESSGGIAAWLFLGGFSLYCIGIAIWIFSKTLYGPYNDICEAFIKLTKLKYPVARILLDVMMVIPGFIFWLFLPLNNDKWNFLFTNFSFGTVAFVFISGPYVNVVKKVLAKFIKIDLWKANILAKQRND